VPLPGPDTVVALTLGVALAIVAFMAAGGLRVERTTYVEIALMLIGAALCAAALMAIPRRVAFPRLYGGFALLGFAVLAILTAASVVWSLAPSESWLEANRTFAYLATFAGGVAFARLAPRRWAGMLHGVALGCTIVSVYALATKVFPGALSPDETYARLREPLGYWNAVGLMAALGVPPLLWLAARRLGHGAFNALAWPGMGLLLVCLMLSYSRGALLALALGLAFWFAVVPLRLRGAVALLGAIVGAAPVVAYGFSKTALTQDRLPAEIRAPAGHELGALLVLMTIALLVAGLLVNYAIAQHPPAEHARRTAGRAIIGLLCVVPVAGALALSTAPGGVSGQVSKAWDQLTNPSARPPSNSPDRLTATSSVRARYWDEALKVWRTSEWLGTGAGAYQVVRTRFREDTLTVRHAHGYVVQTLADLGIAGMAASLAALVAWFVAAIRSTGLRRRDRGLPWDAERVGAVTLFTLALVFGVHSLVDWTWYVPATAVIGLLCAGWVAGRGPLRARLEAREERRAAALMPAPVPELPAAAPGTSPAEREDDVAAGHPVLASEADPAVPPPPAGSGARLRARLASRMAPMRTAGAVVVLVVALTAAWAAFQPVRALHAGDAAIDRFQVGALDAAASIARIGSDRNPLAVEPLYELGYIEDARGRRDDAENAFERAVQLQPANAETWKRLGEYRLNVLDDPEGALRAYKGALYLDPASKTTEDAVLISARAIAQDRANADAKRKAEREDERTGAGGSQP
jgi:O-antigen ligase/Flp pilus assembly protein TadD